MIRGIGTDLVSLKEFSKLAGTFEAFKKYTFSEREWRAASERSNPDAYLASRFAVKEAAFKALAHLLENKQFDMRIIETLNHPDGCPYILETDALKEVMRQADADILHVSISDEDDYVIAFVTAEKR